MAGSRSAAAAPPRRPQPGDLPPSDSEGEEEEEQKQYGKKPARQQGPRDLPPSDSEEEEEHGFEGSDNEGEEREERDEDEDAGAGEDAEPIAVPLLKYLFIGNSMAAHDKNVLLKLGITHVVNCAADEVDNKFENELFVPVKKAAAEEKKEEGEEEGEEEEEVAEEKAAPASAASPAAPAEPQLKALVYTSFPIHDAIDFPIEDFFDVRFCLMCLPCAPCFFLTCRFFSFSLSLRPLVVSIRSLVSLRNDAAGYLHLDTRGEGGRRQRAAAHEQCERRGPSHSGSGLHAASQQGEGQDAPSEGSHAPSPVQICMNLLLLLLSCIRLALTVLFCATPYIFRFLFIQPAPVTMNEGFLGQLVKFEKRLFGVVSVHLSRCASGSVLVPCVLLVSFVLFLSCIT